MIHPSYTELIDEINKNNELDEQPVVNSRYSLVLATSKRARQIIAGSEPLVEKATGKKPLSVAIDEIYKGKVKILSEDALADEEIEDVIEAIEEDSALEETIEEIAEEEIAAVEE